MNKDSDLEPEVRALLLDAFAIEPEGGLADRLLQGTLLKAAQQTMRRTWILLSLISVGIASPLSILFAGVIRDFILYAGKFGAAFPSAFWQSLPHVEPQGSPFLSTVVTACLFLFAVSCVTLGTRWAKAHG